MWEFLGLGRKKEQAGSLQRAIAGSFEKVKSDTSLIFSWLQYFRQKDLANDSRFENLNFHMGNHAAKIEMISNQIMEIKGLQKQAQKAINYDPKIEILLKKIEQLSYEIEALKEAQKTYKTGSFPDQVRTKSEPKNEPVISRKFDRKIIAQARPVKRDYIIHHIMQMIEQGSHTTKELETIIVKEKTLCGRTAFYDYLRELRNKDLVRTSGYGPKKVLVTTQK